MRRCLYMGLLVLVFSCSEEKPANIIPRQQFVSLLIRMHLVEARMSFDQMVDPASVNKNYAVYEDLLKQYGTDSTTLSRTFDYYHNKQKELLTIYEEVQDSLVTMAQKTVKQK